ncbi:MAG: ArsR family transcriptional regulator [Verrucomicrobiales bacterium]|jgi:ArsR family transcriptional regulator
MEQKSAVIALSALAHDARLAIFRLLVVAGIDGIQAGVIAQELGIPKATLSFHLKELSHAGLIKSSRQGRTITYVMLPDGIRNLLTFLTQDCCQGRQELCLLPTDCTNC